MILETFGILNGLVIEESVYSGGDTTLFSKRNVPLIYPFFLVTLGEGQLPWVTPNFLLLLRVTRKRPRRKISSGYLRILNNLSTHLPMVFTK